jgi:hypothetical protein
MKEMQSKYQAYLLNCLLSDPEIMIDHSLLSFEDFAQKHLAFAEEPCYNMEDK